MRFHYSKITTLVFLLACCQAAAYQRLPPGTWFLRVHNPADAKQNLCTRVYFNPNQPPWKGDLLYVTSKGKHHKPASSRKQKPPSEDEWLEPGQSSPWIDISPHMSRKPRFEGRLPYLSPIFLGAIYNLEGDHLRLVVELATGPDKNVQRRLDVNDPKPTHMGASTWLGGPKLPTLALLVPVKPDGKNRIWTAEEAAQQQLDWVKAAGPPPQPPRHILFIGGQWEVAFRNPTRLQALNTKIIRELGYNNLTHYAKDAEDIEAIRATGWEPIPARTMRVWHAENQLAELKEKGLWKWVKLISFGDEISLRLGGNTEEHDAAFVADLRERGFKALDFIRDGAQRVETQGPPDIDSTFRGLDEIESDSKLEVDELLSPADPIARKAEDLSEDERWKLVRLGGPLPLDKPKLFFEAANFRYRLWTRQLAARSAQVKADFPAGVETGANFSPHLSVWPDVRKWINIFRDGGMTTPWSEDWWWQVPEVSPQAYGFLLDALRHAASYHNASYCFFTIPDANYHEGSDIGSHLLRMNYFALGHQAKIIHHFNIHNQFRATCDYIDFLESEAKYRAIHRIITDVSKIDKRLYNSRMRKAEAGIMLSVANDVWNNDLLLSKDPPVEKLYNATLNVDSHERKALWLALRHAHFPVDFLTDEDAAKGIPRRFKVLYVVGDEMLDQAIGPLRQWVREGGTLVGIGGGGVLNQYRESQDGMLDLYGLSAQTAERNMRSIQPAKHLPTAVPMDVLTFDEAHGTFQLPAFCGLQRLTPQPEASVIARLKNGTPGATERRYGKGRALAIGALPGLAYIQPGSGKRPRGMTTTFPDAVRHFITAPAERAGVRRHVTTSDPLVEATLQEGKDGALVTLISFRVALGTWKPPDEQVTVTLSGLPRARKVTSLRHGELKIEQTDRGPQVSVPVDQGDFLVVD